MPVQVLIRDQDVVKRLGKHAKLQVIPTTSGRLAMHIIREVLAAAERQEKDAGELLRELRERSTAA